MKNVLKSVFLVGVTIFLVMPISAHPGNTDSKGGHTNHSTGEYHYHHGYPAHLHPNGECPYDFDDRTGQDSGNTGGSNGSSNHTPSGTSPTVSKSAKNEIHPVLLIGGGGFLVYCLLHGFFWRFKSWLSERKVYNAQRAEYLRLYGGKTRRELAEIAGIPQWVEIGNDGLPKDKFSQDWGPSFTFYVSKSGYSFHDHKHCHPAASIPINAAQLEWRSPCKNCSPRVPELVWYREYLRILGLMKVYKIPIIEEQ